MNDTIPNFRQVIVRQIGAGNIMSISGGRVIAIEDGIELPVSNGYTVRVILDRGADLYNVSRVFRRGFKEFDHGTREGIYAENVGEVAYRAGMFHSYEKGEW